MNSSEAGVLALRTRLETALRDINVHRQLPYELTFSIGLLHCMADDQMSMEDLLARADALMYEEKRSKKR